MSSSAIASSFRTAPCIGGDGYGFVRRADGTHQKIPQTSAVVIEDDVEIGANTTIDRPAVGETRIQAGAKIDNLVQVAHGVNVGRNALLAAQVGIAGSTTIGDGAMLGGQVGVAGHVSIGKNAAAVGQSGITNSIPGRRVRERLSGHRQSRVAEVLRHLPEASGSCGRRSPSSNGASWSSKRC